MWGDTSLSFYVHFSNNKWYWVSFHVPLGHLHVVFGKYLFRSSFIFFIALFVFLLLSCLSCLCHLDISNSSNNSSLVNIVSHFVHCLFTLWWFTLLCKKLLSFVMFHLFIFAFISFASETDTTMIYSKKCLFVFSSRSFRMSYLIFRSLNHFEFICVYDMR